MLGEILGAAGEVSLPMFAMPPFAVAKPSAAPGAKSCTISSIAVPSLPCMFAESGMTSTGPRSPLACAAGLTTLDLYVADVISRMTEVV